MADADGKGNVQPHHVGHRAGSGVSTRPGSVVSIAATDIEFGSKPSVLSGPKGGRRVSSLGTAQHYGHSSWLSATGHCVTAVIGAGVLGLPYSVAWMGWIAGPLALVIFFAVTLWCLCLLTEVYHVEGRRHTTYKAAVLDIMGRKHMFVLGSCQTANQSLTTIGYSIVAAEALYFIVEASSGGAAPFDYWHAALAFGAVQLVMSQLPSLESAWWASAIGAFMSIGYCTIALALGATLASNGLGSLGGKVAQPLTKTMNIFSALGNIGFAYSIAVICLEIQDTLREPPRASVTMKKVLTISLSIAMAFYVAVSCVGYAALGNGVPSEILRGFLGIAPTWVVNLGQAMVIVHMIPAYQVFAQPLFAAMEDVLLLAFPRLAVVPELPVRLVYRSLFVCLTTFISIALPFFSSIIGLVGAITFWPMTVFYPLAMHKRVYPPKSKRTAKYATMVVVDVAMGVVALFAIIGSVYSIAKSASEMTPFANPS